jgi:outer membrane protein, heavy metal efflux system
MKDMTLKRRCFLGMLAFCVCVFAQAQDTLKLTLPEAEKQFLNNNLSLLASKYNIDAASAQVIQAKLYPNPNLQLTGTLYNPKQGKYIDVSNATGEYIVGMQQLILLAGKHNKQIRLADTNVKLAEYRFYDLLRTLRYTLRGDFYNVFYLQNSFNAYQIQINSLENLSNAYEELQAKGVVTLKDAVRIKSLLYSLKAEQTNLQNQINDLQSELRLLLQNNKVFVVPVIESNLPPPDFNQFNLQSLIDTAYAYRYDLKTAETNLVYSKLNYRLQKAMAVPDLTLGGAFDKRGSFTENASFLNVSIDLPFFNRNQGNIKAAKTGISQSQTELELQKLSVENQVQNSYIKILNISKMLQSMDPQFRLQFEKLLQGITENFQKKNISLIEFTDFYESYKNNILQLNQLQYQRMQAIEDLHFAIGKTLFNN